ncbi:uncharacterized protein LOC142340674 isoform X1 [Convolutriloba macropyga]|uniref:uncharacterized protein LOC142340674 isoform X1 n=1 Tax=Convolutriloba macropyga TaxID=536237 RepID=UPI003F526E93
MSYKFIPDTLNCLESETGASLASTTDASGAPNVDLALSTSPTSFVPSVDPVKLAAKSAGTGLGAGRRKAGGGKLGAQKIKVANFSELESKASEQEKYSSGVSKDPLTVEEEKRQLDDICKNAERVSLQREKVRQTDPQKADQMERLGLMGGGSNRASNNRQQSAASTAKSHSALSDMVVIDQARATNNNSNGNYHNSFSSFNSWNSGGGGGRGFGDDSRGGSRFDNMDDDDIFGSSRKRDQDQFFDAISDEPLKPVDSRSNSNYGGGGGSQWSTSSNRNGYGGGSVSNGSGAISSSSNNSGSSSQFSNKFSNAKSISSNQYFGREPADDFGSIDHSKYTGASSISSRDLFGGGNEGPTNRYSYSGGGGGGGYGGGSYSGPDVEQMKDDLKHGISSLAGKLSRATASVMDSIQDRYT